jgi:hypothetical protein
MRKQFPDCRSIVNADAPQWIHTNPQLESVFAAARSAIQHTAEGLFESLARKIKIKQLAIVLCLCPLMAQVQTAEMQPSIQMSSSVAALPQQQSSAIPHPFAVADPPVNLPKRDGHTLYRWSLAAALAGTAADTFSSWSHPEANPLLANPGSNFDARSAVLKSALLGASFLIEYYALRHNPHLYRHFAWLNFTIAGVLGGAVAHNMLLH